MVDSTIDPRSRLSASDLADANRLAAPAVAVGAGGRDGLITIAGAVGVLALGAVAFFGVSGQRTAPVPTAIAVHAIVPAVTKNEARVAAPATAISAPPLTPAAATAATPTASPASVTSVSVQPVLVVDLGVNSGPVAPDGGVNVKPTQGPGPGPGQTADEMFAGRVTATPPDVAHSASLMAPSLTIAEGAIIPAVLETAIDTDLSGFVRALITRDVRSFDGSNLLVPRGSRLIGQYRSGLFAGQTRVYIIWSRLIRPDGVSVRLGSPGIDMAGQSGGTGQIDNHDAQRYGPTVMLSLLSGAVNAITNRSSVTISSSQGAQEAASIALQTGVKISPTVRVPQGAPIQVFVTKDLQFDAPAVRR